tara:strand:- start:4677 stop:5807 length:1131 start_codon:yes stop_codon:yes gene_type:complete
MASLFIKKKFIKYLKNYLKILFFKLNIFNNFPKHHDTKIKYVVEKENWSIKWDGKYISSKINQKLNSNIISISDLPDINKKNKLIHFGSQYMWVDWYELMPNDKKYVVSFFHGKKSDGPKVKEHIEDFLKSQNSIYKVITASSLIQQRLLNWGIPKSKLEIIPIGVDTNLFSMPSNIQRLKIRKKLGLRKDQLIIGSFQKDGQGWVEGNIPKLIKGPDLFVRSVEIIAKQFPVVVLLTGPARGYVKKQLSKRQIKFIHIFAKSYNEIADLYHALDLYIVSSREEGGPKAIVESMASGVPIISTNVGMAKDFIIDGKNGGLVDSFDPKEIAHKSIEIINFSEKEVIINTAREDVMRADWRNVAYMYWDKVYKAGIKN